MGTATKEFCMQVIVVSGDASFDLYVDENNQLIIYITVHTSQDLNRYEVENYSFDPLVPFAKRRGTTLLQFFDKFGGQALSINGETGPFGFISDIPFDPLIAFGGITPTNFGLDPRGNSATDAAFATADFSSLTTVTYTQFTSLTTHSAIFPSSFDTFQNSTFGLNAVFQFDPVGGTYTYMVRDA